MKSKNYKLPLLIISLILLIFISIGYYFGLAIREAASIGIIGGADGPTAIFIGYSYNYYYLLIPLLIIVAGLIGFWVLKKRQKRQ